MRIKPQDLTGMTSAIKIAVQAAVAQFMEENKQMSVVTRINYNNLNHSELQPEGHVFTAQIAVEVHEKTKKEE